MAVGEGPLLVAQRVLPKVFKDFLLAMGKKAGKLWGRAVFNCPDIERLKHSAQNLLNYDGNPIVLPDDAFVFLMEEGMVFFIS